MPRQFISIKEASEWASRLLDREVTTSNISYLIQYGKIKKYGSNGTSLINTDDLKKYYDSYRGKREISWKEKLGDDLNWKLSFDHLREKDTTKHVHRLHPYKGKFIPQLVEYFIDNHTDEFKTKNYFEKGDIILDPFAGSGTTLVQANELGIHSIGIDISRFNCLISEVKLLSYNFESLFKEIQKIKQDIASFEYSHKLNLFEEELYSQLTYFNNKFFLTPSFKYRLNKTEIDEERFCNEKESEFLETYNQLIDKYQIKLKQEKFSNFLDKWYIENVRREIDFVFSLIRKVSDINNKKVLAVILSRTIRSCRATTHSDLATLKEPQLTTYYCYKHKKICKPIFSIKNMLFRYLADTVFRLMTFNKLKSSSHFALLSSDSRTVNIEEEIKKKKPKFYDLLKKQKIRGVFTSPPYVGQIDYHEQHAYAYDLMGFERKDELEIGPLYKGQGAEARKSYIDGISQVLLNCKNFLADDFDIFLVANDKYNLYPTIAERSNMKIVNQFKRPVLNRTERDKSPYSEIIFHFKNVL